MQSLRCRKETALAMLRSRNSLREVVKKTAPLTLFVNAISVAVSYGLYEAAFHLSMLPVWITAGMSIFAIVGPNVVVLLDKNNSRLVALGVANGFMIMVFYFFAESFRSFFILCSRRCPHICMPVGWRLASQ